MGGGEEKCIQSFGKKTEGKKWIILALTETELEFVDLAGGSGPVVGSCEHNNELLGSMKCP